MDAVEKYLGHPVDAACMVRAPGQRGATWRGALLGAMLPGGAVVEMVGASVASQLLRRGAQKGSGAPAATDRMALVLTDQRVCVHEVHRRKMYVRDELFSFVYADVKRADLEWSATSVLLRIRLRDEQLIQLEAPRMGNGAEAVVELLRQRALGSAVGGTAHL
jgi:hypothetical protein